MRLSFLYRIPPAELSARMTRGEILDCMAYDASYGLPDIEFLKEKPRNPPPAPIVRRKVKSGSDQLAIFQSLRNVKT